MKDEYGAARIRNAMNEIDGLRRQLSEQPKLSVAMHRVKAYQCIRFESYYADLLADPTYAPACNFFLHELYSPKDFGQRDAEFSRIALAIERLFPQSVVRVVITLAELHALTERLDMQMAALVSLANDLTMNSQLPDRVYKMAWRKVGTESVRLNQLSSVIELGCQLKTITRMPGIKFTLRAMRGPAKVANLSHLQAFLEAGFETFSTLASNQSNVDHFLETLLERETYWIQQMFHP